MQTQVEKPIVHYIGEAIKYQGRAVLMPVDHPNHLKGHDVSNEEVVTTSLVLSWEDGRIETKNTVYVPQVQ